MPVTKALAILEDSDFIAFNGLLIYYDYDAFIPALWSGEKIIFENYDADNFKFRAKNIESIKFQ